MPMPRWHNLVLRKLFSFRNDQEKGVGLEFVPASLFPQGYPGSKGMKT